MALAGKVYPREIQSGEDRLRAMNSEGTGC